MNPDEFIPMHIPLIPNRPSLNAAIIAPPQTPTRRNRNSRAHVPAPSLPQHDQGFVFVMADLPSTPDMLQQFDEQGIPVHPVHDEAQHPIAAPPKPKSANLFEQFQEDKLMHYLKYIAPKIYFCALNGEIYEGDNIGLLEIHLDDSECILLRLNGAGGQVNFIYGGRLVIDDDNYITGVSDFIVKLLKRIYFCDSCQSFDIFNTLSTDWCKDCFFMDMYKCPDDNCSICMEKLSEKPRFLTECNHHFHMQCLHKLNFVQRNKKKCPLCRFVFDSTRNCVGDISYVNL
jgi:hypothetical protein